MDPVVQCSKQAWEHIALSTMVQTAGSHRLCIVDNLPLVLTCSEF